MLVFINGRLVPEEEAKVSVFDRSFLYGDGLFETLRVTSGRPFRWRQHLDRLQQGAAFLGIQLPFASEELRRFAGQIIRENQMPESLLRLHLSRGVGRRGYSSKGADQPSFVMSLHAVPAIDFRNFPQWRLKTSSVRLLADDPLAAFKTCNKLPQILARSEADEANFDEALLLNSRGEVVEASSSNLFWVADHVICTPPLNSGILPGVTRAVVLELCEGLGLSTRERVILPAELRQVQGIFLSTSSWGIIEATALDDDKLAQSPLVSKIRTAYEGELKSRVED